jgi:hypothetical protein
MRRSGLATDDGYQRPPPGVIISRLFGIPGLPEKILEQETAVPQRLFAQFPMQVNREHYFE